MSEIAQMADPNVLHLDDKGDVLAALFSSFAVVESADARDERPVDLVLARSVEDDRMAGDCLQECVVVVAVAQGDNVRSRLSDRVPGRWWTGVGDYGRFASADAE